MSSVPGAGKKCGPVHSGPPGAVSVQRSRPAVGGGVGGEPAVPAAQKPSARPRPGRERGRAGRGGGNRLGLTRAPRPHGVTPTFCASAFRFSVISNKHSVLPGDAGSYSMLVLRERYENPGRRGRCQCCRIRPRRLVARPPRGRRAPARPPPAIRRRGPPGPPGPALRRPRVEGAARDVTSVPGVRVEAAPGSGDDRIDEVVAEGAGRGAAVLVVTADRELRQRVEAYGARCAGPRTVRPRPGGADGP